MGCEVPRSSTPPSKAGRGQQDLELVGCGDVTGLTVCIVVGRIVTSLEVSTQTDNLRWQTVAKVFHTNAQRQVFHAGVRTLQIPGREGANVRTIQASGGISAWRVIVAGLEVVGQVDAEVLVLPVEGDGIFPTEDDAAGGHSIQRV